MTDIRKTSDSDPFNAYLEPTTSQPKADDKAKAKFTSALKGNQSGVPIPGEKSMSDIEKEISGEAEPESATPLTPEEMIKADMIERQQRDQKAQQDIEKKYG